MSTGTGPILSSHLSDFETTTSDLLRPRDARALLNFAALFHEVIYLTDTALGDHQLIIRSFQQDGHAGLFGHISGLIQAGIAKVLCRNRVVVRDKVLVDNNPSISEIFEGWRYRDNTEWKGETGFTTTVEDRARLAYNREVDALLLRYEAIQRYDADIPKAAFRQSVLNLLGNDPSLLSQSVARLPPDLRRMYLDATKDDRFTNADLWRVLKQAPDATEAIILHAHVNQQCFADLTDAGQSAQDRTRDSLASFNLELQRHQPYSIDVEATLDPPENLDELLERAPVRLPPLETYWGYIIEALEQMNPEKVFRPTSAGLFVEDELPTLSKLYKRYGKGIFVMLLRLKLASLATPVSDAFHRFGVILLQKRTDELQEFRGAVPPWSWHRRGILGLDRVTQARPKS